MPRQNLFQVGSNSGPLELKLRKGSTWYPSSSIFPILLWGLLMKNKNKGTLVISRLPGNPE